MMYDPNRFWKVLCCKKAEGICKGCKNKVLAYVLNWIPSNQKNFRYKEVHFRMCPLAFQKKSKPDEKMGWTILHELIHMSSGAGDEGYSKKQTVALGKNDPELARLNAQNYMYYAM